MINVLLKHPTLVSLILMDIFGITGSMIDRMDNLKMLTLKRCFEFDDRIIRKASNLETLSIEFCEKIKGLDWSDFPSLRSFDLRDNPFVGPEVLLKMKRLEVLVIEKCDKFVNKQFLIKQYAKTILKNLEFVSFDTDIVILKKNVFFSNILSTFFLHSVVI